MRTGIEWTDETWNPIAGCTKVSEGCRNCYAMRMAQRIAAAADARARQGETLTPRQEAYRLVTKRTNDELATPLPQWNNVVVPIPDALDEPKHWRKPRRVFVNSTSDVFHEAVPTEFIARIWATMENCGPGSWCRDDPPRVRDDCHTFQVLTKRPERMAALLNDPAFWAMVDDFSGCDRSRVRPLPHIWVGTSVEDQPAADERVPELLKCPAAVRFLSCEPLLGAVDLRLDRICPGDQERFSRAWEGGIRPPLTCGIHWVIAGGESGPGARATNVEWHRALRDQCRAAGVPFFEKQLGAWMDGPHEGVCVQRWLVKDAEGRTGVWRPPIFRSDRCPERFDGRPDNAVAWGLADLKGGDPAEWPADLRVREFPGGGG